MVRFVYTPCDITVKDFGEREIIYAFHDVDGTHSLIREWPPVMSVVLDYVSRGGVPEGYDSDESVKTLVERAGKEALPETDRFCVESAGLSALVQMEWGLRRAIDAKIIKVDCDFDDNRDKITRIGRGEETFTTPDTPELAAFLKEHTPRLFKLYEKVLNGYCRDKNLAEARKNPEKFTVKGSMKFLGYLHEHGVKNYFVTGAVVEKGMGMHEEVEALGFKIGAGEMIEDIIGSTWTQKLPKDEIMQKLLVDLGADGKNVLVTGDGRSEIFAGDRMGALCISRLNADDAYKRQLHKALGTHIIVEDFTNENLYKMMK